MSAAASQLPTPYGKYTLVELLGRGGMAEIWRAELAGPGGLVRRLVLKLILPALADDERFVHMFTFTKGSQSARA